MEHITRRCTRCGLSYEAGTYRTHRVECVRGAKFREEIAALVASGLSQSQVARLKGVSRQWVNDIVRGRTAA